MLGRAEFVGLTCDFLQAHREARLLGRAEAGNRVASIFEFVMEAPDGQLACPVAEWATVVDGRISNFVSTTIHVFSSARSAPTHSPRSGCTVWRPTGMGSQHRRSRS
jgi:hypothetical protein